jgi:hypothetical protein
MVEKSHGLMTRRVISPPKKADAWLFALPRIVFMCANTVSINSIKIIIEADHSDE